MIKKILIVLLILFVIAQFFRPQKNNSDDNTRHMATQYPIPDEVGTVLKTSCYDCHSNNTQYPWYSNIQPVSAWMANHVKEGKRELNFSDFTGLKISVQNHKFEEIVEMIKEDEMPLSSYTWLGMHHEAKLSESQKSLLVNWAEQQMALLKSKYPPDSLIMRRDNPPAPAGS